MLFLDLKTSEAMLVVILPACYGVHLPLHIYYTAGFTSP